MINDKSSYNIEDTARLMTSSKGPKRKLMIILIVIALLLVLAIGIFGVRNIKEKRYNAQVEMADKAFVEGNYELAESGYLKAVGMNKRKPKARENLAYTYAVQDRLEDAARMYDELYKDTKEPKYQEAFQDTSEGRVPANPEMAPAKGVWREVDFDIVPYKETLNDYIVRMTFDCFSVVSGTGMGKDASFDYKNPDGFFVLPVVLGGCGLYGFSIEEQIKYKSEGGNDVATPGFEMKEGIDPRNWIKNNDENQLEDFFIVYEADIADNVIRNVFNLNDEHIDNMVKKGEKEKRLYKENGKYYYFYGWATGYPDPAAEIKRVWTDAEKYCIEYDSGRDEGDGFIIDTEAPTRYMIMAPKLIGGQHYWSIYYNSQNAPGELQSFINNKEKIKIEGSQNDEVFSKIEGEELVFSSGVGAWDTSLSMKANGEFEGIYRDTNMGDIGEGYPHGSVLYCKFRGRFGNPRKISEYEYRVELEELEIIDKDKGDYIEEGVKYELAEPYGIVGGKEFAVYLAGMNSDELPDRFIEWIEMRSLDTSLYIPNLTSCGIYNINTEEAFY